MNIFKRTPHELTIKTHIQSGNTHKRYELTVPADYSMDNIEALLVMLGMMAPVETLKERLSSEPDPRDPR